MRVQHDDRCLECDGAGRREGEDCGACHGMGVPFRIAQILDNDAGLTNTPAKPHRFLDGTLVENIDTGVRLFVWGAEHHDAAGNPVYSLATRADDSWVILEAGVPEAKLFDVHAELLAGRADLSQFEQMLDGIQFGGLASVRDGIVTVVVENLTYTQWLDAARRGLNLTTENRRLQQWVRDMQEGCWVNCVYCGHRYGHEKDTPVTLADVLKQHVEQCPEHPMSALKTRVTSLETAMHQAVEIMSRQRLGAVDSLDFANALGVLENALGDQKAG